MARPGTGRARSAGERSLEQAAGAHELFLDFGREVLLPTVQREFAYVGLPADSQEHVAQVGLRHDADFLARLDQGVEDGRSISAALVADIMSQLLRPTATARSARSAGRICFSVSMANQRSI
jgi:hypothetical protein